MGTYYHTLTREPLRKLPGRIISLDCEPTVLPDLSIGWSSLHRLKVGALIVTDYHAGRPVRTKERTFTRQEECWSAVETSLLKGRLTWLVAHGLSYDWTLAGGWRWVDSGRAKLQSYTIDDPPVVLWLAVGDRELRVVDLMNYWRKPLPFIADALSLPCEVSDPVRDDTDRAAAVALSHARVVDKAVSMMVSMLADAMGGGWAPTAAGISWNCFRSRKWGEKIRIHNDPDATRLERASYTGGRVEVYRRGPVAGPIYAVDVNNLYGSVMVGRRYPLRLDHVGPSTPSELLRVIQDGGCVVAAVRARVDQSSVPVKVEETSWYPVGTFDTVLSGPDLLPLLQSGRVTIVHEAAFYQGGDPFGLWVPHWYSWRLTQRAIGNRAGAALTKLITSTLFGRFGMVGRKWQPYPSDPPPGRYRVWHERGEGGKGWVRCRTVAGTAQKQCMDKESTHSAVAIASYVTAYARQEMIRLRGIAGPETVCYEDTDCLHLTREGYERVIAAACVHHDGLGRMKLVGEYGTACYLGPKVYTIDSSVTAAGLRADATQVADGIYLQELHAGMPRVAKEGPRDEVIVRQTPYTLGQ